MEQYKSATRSGLVGRYLTVLDIKKSCRLVCSGAIQVCDKIGACQAISDSVRSQKVLSGVVGCCRLVFVGARQIRRESD